MLIINFITERNCCTRSSNLLIEKFKIVHELSWQSYLERIRKLFGRLLYVAWRCAPRKKVRMKLFANSGAAGATSTQIKNPAGTARYVRELFGGGRTGVAARCDRRDAHARSKSMREPNERREKDRETRERREQEGGEKCCCGVAVCLAVARTRARSVVMSAGGQAADYYHCMNMNETGRRTRTRTKARGNGREEGEGGGS